MPSAIAPIATTAGLRALAFALNLHIAPDSLGIASACPADSAVVHDFFARYRTALPTRLAIARGALVIVCGRHITFAEGFGRTAAGDLVNPERTLFRAASNSKLFAATAVMQLVDNGTWRLDDDVNRYLPPAARLAPLETASPVTLAHLLTHTAGFEDKFAGSVVVPADRLTLADFFRRHTPRRVTPPGQEVSYSNVGMALAGYLVEAKAGEPFATYAERHIFTPLGMTRSSFDQPPPAAWTRDLAGGPPRGRYDVVFNPYPAASLVTTPADMARFLAAHVTDDAVDDALGSRILSPAALEIMHATHWRAQPDAPGVAYGFFEGTLDGHRVLYHTGDSGDHSVVLLVPDEQLGLYFVFSGTDEQTEARDRFVRAFAERFLPQVAPVASAVSAADTSGSVAHFAGTYRNVNYSRSNYEKARALFAQVTVRMSPRGTLLVTPPGASTPLELARTGPLTFASDSGEVVAFRRARNGAVLGFTLGGLTWDPSSWDRIPWWLDGRVHLAALGTALGLLGLRLAWTPVAWAVRRVRKVPPVPISDRARTLWRGSWVVAATVFAAPVVAAATALLSFTHPLRAVPRAVAVLTTLLLLAVVAGVMLGITLRTLRRDDAPRAHRLAIAATSLACAMLALILAYWRLLAPWSLG